MLLSSVIIIFNERPRWGLHKAAAIEYIYLMNMNASNLMIIL